MKFKTAILTFVSTSYLVFNFFSFSEPVLASEHVQTSELQNFEKWKKEFKETALSQGVKKSNLNKVLSEVKLLPKVIDSDKKQSEFLLTFWDYTNRTLSESRIKKGREILKENQAFLKHLEKTYSVPASYLVAFWGLETNYGLFKGKIKTLDALATLAYDKRRRSFFTRELITLLKLMDQGETTSFYGSWAGAFGNFQFMPTTYAAYGVDADGDGKKDIINSLPDAFSSAANYLTQLGWKKDEHWGREVRFVKKIDWNKVSAKSQQPVFEWIKLGIVPFQSISDKEKKLSAKLIMPMGHNGPKFLVYSNFDRILKWNNSILYALSVGLLSDIMLDQKFKLYAKNTNEKISKKDIERIQILLSEKGFYHGKSDGILGRDTRKSIQIYQKRKGLPQDGYPSVQLIKRLTKEK
ncbi:MAG: lytic murein transglycosylase [Alphaproteobacteria bacterium]|nr:lytic murein transglycosylase [Alphaproteobacteria bacterium]